MKALWSSWKMRGKSNEKCKSFRPEGLIIHKLYISQRNLPTATVWKNGREAYWEHWCDGFFYIHEGQMSEWREKADEKRFMRRRSSHNSLSTKKNDTVKKFQILWSVFWPKSGTGRIDLKSISIGARMVFIKSQTAAKHFTTYEAVSWTEVIDLKVRLQRYSLCKYYEKIMGSKNTFPILSFYSRVEIGT